MNQRPLLIIPVESQVRELDAKLLLACCAAERGYEVVLGSRAYVHFAIGTLPRGIYIAKSMRGLSALMFRLIRELGHAIIAWEEEALVHPPPGIFYSLRLSPGTLRHVSHLFAWGEENRTLLLQYPGLPSRLRLHVTGNPRGDMLRPELRPFFAAQAQALREEYGDFLLVNTNFTDVNPYLPTLGLFVPSRNPGKPARFGQAGQGMPRHFAAGLERHKQAILEAFLAMIPALEAALPGVTLVVRPHPSEDDRIYHEVAARCQRVRVIHRGNVVPWLLACRALVHNGCTTAVESYAVGVPSVAYLPTYDEVYDEDFQGLPNRLSSRCFRMDELVTSLRAILDGSGPAVASPDRDALIDHYIAARRGPLASECILDVLDRELQQGLLFEPVRPPLRVRASVLVRLKAWLTQLYMHRPGPNRRSYHDHRFPPLSEAEVAQRIARLGSALGRFGAVRVRQRGKHMFDIHSVATGL